MECMENINWSALRGNKYSRKPTKEMLQPGGFVTLGLQRVVRGRNARLQPQVPVAIQYDKEYVFDWIRVHFEWVHTLDAQSKAEVVDFILSFLEE